MRQGVRSWRLVHQKRGARYLRAARGSHARVSTGMGVPWRDNEDGPAAAARAGVGAPDPVASFEELMAERIADTVAAMVPAASRAGEAPAVDEAFALLDADQRGRLLAIGELRRFTAGEAIVHAGAHGAPLHVLESGQAQLVIGGRAVEGVHIRPGEIVGEISFLDGGPASASVIAEDDVETTAFPRTRIAELLTADPALAAAFYRSLGALAARRLRQGS